VVVARTWGWFLRQDLRSSARRPRATPPDAIRLGEIALCVCRAGLASSRRGRGLIKGNRVDLDGLPVRFGSRWIYDDS
jgi:hypothetical protein